MGHTTKTLDLGILAWDLADAFAKDGWEPFVETISSPMIETALPAILALLGFDPTGQPLTETPTVTEPAEDAKHTCNPRQPGKPLPFGKRDPLSQCPRCRQLDAGAAPRSAPAWVEDRQRAARDAAAYDAHRRDHFKPGGEHERVCAQKRSVSTCFDW